MRVLNITNYYYNSYFKAVTQNKSIPLSFKKDEKECKKPPMVTVQKPISVSEAFGAKNFALNREIETAGKFIYDGMRDLNSMSGLNDSENLFGFLYKTSVGLERLQKVAYILMKNPDNEEYKQVEQEVRTHSHSELQKMIKKLGGKELPSNQNEFLRILDKFYKTYRYDKFNLSFDLDGEKRMFSDFINNNLDKKLNAGGFYNASVDEQTKRFVGRIIKKISANYYDIIKTRAAELNLYTYELNPNSKSMVVFGNTDDKDLQRHFVNERTACKELLIFLMNTKEKSGLTNYIKKIPPLDIDIALLDSFLPEIVKGNIPQELMDEVETIYSDMDKEERDERRQMLSIVAEPDCYFDDEEEI